MRYESIPKKITRWATQVFKHLKNEFGNWAYVIVAGVIAILWKPITGALGFAADFISYITLGAIILGILYVIYRKIVK